MYDLRLRIADCGLRIADCGLRIAEFTISTAELRFFAFQYFATILRILGNNGEIASNRCEVHASDYRIFCGWLRSALH